MKKKLVGLAVTLILLVSLLLPSMAMAQDPQVTMTVTGAMPSATNTQDTWALGFVVADDVVYFSATGAEDDDYSQVQNTGNVAIDVALEGTDYEGGAYDWTLATAAGSEAYSLYANQSGTPTVYDVEIKSSSYTDLCTSLAVSANYTWSMKFTAPTSFNESDDGTEKSSVLTLAVSIS